MNGEMMQVPATTTAIAENTCEGTAHPPSACPLSMITMAISALGIMLMPSNRELAHPTVIRAGAHVPMILPRTATPSKIPPRPRAVVRVEGSIFKPMPIKKKGVKKS